MPDFDAVVLPEKKKLEPTKPEPFRLLVDQRGAVKSSRLEQMVQRLVLLRSPNCRNIFPESNVQTYPMPLQVKEEQKQHEEAVHFKARPNMVTSKEPFQPKKENRVPIGKWPS